MDVYFSIITINKNNAFGLEQTLQSIITQEKYLYELIIIDGKSEDNSLDIINKYQKYITYSISELDTGVYNAMNKGIKKAKGKYVIFMNSGDKFVNPNILKMIKEMSFNSDFIFGATNYKKGKSCLKIELPQKISFSLFVSNGICHQSSFIKRYLFDEIGYYDENEKILSDWMFFITALGKYNKNYSVVKFPISEYDMNGMSSFDPNISYKKEHFLKNEFAFFYNDYRKFSHFEKFSYYNLKIKLKWILYNIKYKLNI